MPRRKRRKPNRIAGNDRAHNPPQPSYPDTPDNRPRNDPARKPKRPKKPKPAPTAAQDERRLNPGYSDPPAPPAPPSRPSGPDPNVVQKQRQLRAAGFPVRVDGSWGARSQAYWRQYRAGVRPLAHAPEKRPRIILPNSRLIAQVNREIREANLEARQARLQAQTEAARARGLSIAVRNQRATFATALSHGPGAENVSTHRSLRRQAERAATALALRQERRVAEEFAASARRKKPERMSLDELIALTVDPLTGELNPRDQSDVLRVQRWLQAHGHPKLDADGVFGRNTFKALVTSYTRALEAEKRDAEERLVERLYRVRALHPNDVLPVVGANPSKEEVLRVLRAGGFSAGILWEQLNKLSRDRSTEFLAWRERETFRLGKQAFGPFIKSVFAGDPNQLLRSVILAYGNENIPLGRMRVDSEKLGEFGAATSFQDLKRRLTLVDANRAGYKGYQQAAMTGQVKKLSAAEYLLMKQKADMAKNDGDFWKGALNVVFEKPGEALQDGLVDAAVRLKEVFEHPLDIRMRRDLMTREEVRATSEAWEAKFRKEHPVLNALFDVAVDPWWFAPGAGKIGAGFAAVERYGYTINAAGKLAPGFLSIPKRATGIALTIPARSGRSVAADVRWVVEGTGLVVPESVKRFGRGLSAAKGEAVGKARAKVNLLLTHHFRPRPGVDVPEIKVSPKVMQLVEDAIPDADRRTLTFLSYLYETFRDGRISFYAGAERGVRSNPAEAVMATAAEYFRVVEVERRALVEAQREYDRVFASTGKDAGARRAGTRAYKRVKNDAGSYLVGAPMPGRLGREIEDVVQMKLSQIRDVIFPLLQDRLERELDELGESLFDENRRWAQRGGELDDLYRQMGRDAFGDASRTVKVRNPLRGKTFTLAEKVSLESQEVARRIGRLKGWAAREAAHGRPRSEEEVRRLADEIREEVGGNWLRNGDGTWYDDRAELDVLDIYARQQTEVYAREAEDAIPETVRDVIAQLPARPADTFDSPLQVELRNLAWALGGADELDAVAPILDNAIVALRPVNLDSEAAGAFQQSVTTLGDALGQAWQRAYPSALRQQYGYWRAFAEAQSLPARLAYNGLSGALRVWIFLTLPFRPGWAFRNIVDNFSKILLAGVHDPRIFFLGAETPGAGIRSFFENGLSDVRLGIATFDRMFGTDGARHWDAMIEQLFDKGSDVLKPIFDAHNITVPSHVIDSSLLRPWDSEFTLNLVRKPAIVKDKRAQKAFEELTRWERFKRSPRAFQDGLWELMASRPESYFKRVLYRDAYTKALKRELDAGLEIADAEMIAFAEGWKTVEKHLFDYSRESVLEENLRFVFPFVQFWRKNTLLWAEHFVNKPWLPREIVNFEHALQEEVNADLPEWSRRYVNSQELGNGIAKIPGFGWLGNYVASLDVMYDPLNFFSFAPLYRAFKQENPLLPADKAGMRFIAPMVDAMNEWGLSMNPLLRKPLEVAGVFNFRAWQAVFPQTPVAQAMTRKYLGERFPNGINIEALMFDPLFGTPTNEAIAESFNEYVQLEMANQAVRGEPVDRAKATKKVEDFFFVQTIFGYFSGAYVRRMTPEDFYLYGLAESFHKGESDYRELSEKDKQAYRLYKFRKLDRVEFDRYVATIPLIQAYYKLGTWELKEKFKQEHPEILPWVEPVWAGKGFDDNYVKTAALVQDTQFVKEMSDLADDLDLPDSVRRTAEAAFVTPELQAFWDRSATPKKYRDRHLRLLYHRHLKLMNDVFQAIPDTDYDAKKGYLEQNPMLVHWWRQNDSASDEYLALINSANADLREAYFEHVDAGDWASADGFLRRYPFIFEFTKAADRVDDDGNWISKFQGSGRSRNFGRGRRRFGLTEHARDYLAVRGLLTAFFGMKSEFDRQAWLEAGGEDQKKVLAYFRKWGSKDGQSEHARAFARAKPSLDIYFKMPKKERKAWLNGGSKDANIALAYFKRWSKLNYLARLWAKMPESKNPELARRLKFWHTYFSLSPDKRPAYATREAEAHGVFIYGPFSVKEREKRESEYLRKLYAHGVSKRASYYLYVRPLLDEWHKLKSRKDKQLFLRANPELSEYLDEFSTGLATGNKKLDNLLQAYFELPDRSPRRSEFIKAHPEVQDYFDEHSTPAERAMRRLLEVYFKVPVGPKRKAFLLQHPEIRAYFDQRKLERDLEKGEAELFAELDPRLKPYRDFSEVDSQGAQLIAEREAMLRRERHRRSELEVRRDRRS